MTWPSCFKLSTARWPTAWAVLVLAHVAGALKHRFIDRDGLLARMSLRRA